MTNYIITLTSHVGHEKGLAKYLRCYSPVKRICLNTISNNKEVLWAEVTQERSHKIVLFQVIL